MDITYFRTLPRILPLKKPKGSCITLNVRGSRRLKALYIETSKAEKIASLLAITVRQLDDFVRDALVSEQPVVVVYYQQRDVAETKLWQINKHIPFIKGTRHWFDLQSE